MGYSVAVEALYKSGLAKIQMQNSVAREALCRVDLEHLMENQKFLTPDEVDLLRHTIQRIDAFPQYFGRTDQNYPCNAAFILLSKYRHKKRFCSCRPSRRCRLWKVCPACAFVDQMTNIRRFVTKFRSTKWFHLTVSFERLFDISMWQEQDLDVYWDACVFAILRMVELGRFDGIFLFEELYVGSFFPAVLVVPHVHVIVATENLTDDDLRIVKELIVTFRGERKIPLKRVSSFEGEWVDKANRWGIGAFASITISPNLDVKAITDQAYFAEALRYMGKSSDWATVYSRDWERHDCWNNVNTAFDLNTNTDVFIEAWYTCIHCRKQRLYAGNLHSNKSEFIGVKKAVRNSYDHRERVNTMLMDWMAEHR